MLLSSGASTGLGGRPLCYHKGWCEDYYKAACKGYDDETAMKPFQSAGILGEFCRALTALEVA